MRIAIALAFLLIFGAVKLPFERALSKEQRAAKFHLAELSVGLREQIGQGAFIAALGGMRSVIADLLTIRAHVAFQNTEWGRVRLLYDAATSLQPRATMFWDDGAWHMAYNASVSAFEDPNQPREALRRKAQREYFKLGEEYLLEGIQYNSDRAILFDRLGMLYQDKFKDYCRASWAYAEAAKRPDAMPYCYRFSVYYLARCPGHEREAYAMLRELYQRSPDERTPTAVRTMDTLQEKLGIPPEERINTDADWKELEKSGFRR